MGTINPGRGGGADAAARQDAAAALALARSLEGDIELASYPGVITGAGLTAMQRIANDAAIQSAIDWCTANRRRLVNRRGGTFEVLSNRKDANGRNVGIYFKAGSLGFLGIGASVNGTRLIQFGANQPVVTMGPTDGGNPLEGAEFIGFNCNYGVSQAGQTQAIAFQQGKTWRCKFEFLATDSYAFHPYDAWRDYSSENNQFNFQNRYDEITLRTFQRDGFSVTLGGTGNKLGTFYIGGGGVGSRLAPSGIPFNYSSAMSKCIGKASRINFEWITADTLVFIANATGELPAMYSEGCKAGTGWEPCIVKIVSAKIDLSIDVTDWWVPDTTLGTAKVFHVDNTYSPTQLHVRRCNMVWQGGNQPEFKMLKDIVLVGGVNQNAYLPQITVENYTAQGNEKNIDLEANLPAATYGAVRSCRRMVFKPLRSVTEGAEIVLPSTGTSNLWGCHEDAQYVLQGDLAAAKKLIWKDTRTHAGYGSTAKRKEGDLCSVWRQGAGAGIVTIRNPADTADLTTLAAAGTKRIGYEAGLPVVY